MGYDLVRGNLPTVEILQVLLLAGLKSACFTVNNFDRYALLNK